MVKIKKIGIVGGGKMGTDIFNFLCQYPFEIVWYNRSSSEKAEKKYRRSLERALLNGLISKNTYNFKLHKHRIISSVDAFTNVDLIIESVSEDTEVKRNLIKLLFSNLSSDVIIASNSSSIHPDELCPEKKYIDRIIGLHFFYPLKLKSIAEFVISKNTSDKTILNIKAFLKDININYLIQNEETAFLLNRIILQWQAKAFNYVNKHNSSFSEVDAVIKKNLCPTGIFEMIDHVGIEIIYSSALNYLKNESDHFLFKALLNFMKNCIKEKKTGIKTQQGFYTYPLNETTFLKNSPEETVILKYLVKSFFDSYNWATDNINNKNINLDVFLNEYLDADIKQWIKFM